MIGSGKKRLEKLGNLFHIQKMYQSYLKPYANNPHLSRQDFQQVSAISGNIAHQSWD